MCIQDLYVNLHTLHRYNIPVQIKILSVYLVAVSVQSFFGFELTCKLLNTSDSVAKVNRNPCVIILMPAS